MVIVYFNGKAVMAFGGDEPYEAVETFCNTRQDLGLDFAKLTYDEDIGYTCPRGNVIDTIWEDGYLHL